jgi:hypothetical protein
VFRAQLILHDKAREGFKPSLRLARAQGYLKGKRGMQVAMNTAYILGRGAVKATCNLLDEEAPIDWSNRRARRTAPIGKR